MSGQVRGQGGGGLLPAMDAHVAQEPEARAWDGKPVPLPPRSQCLYLCNGDKLVKVRTLQRVASMEGDTGLATPAPLREATHAMEALRVRESQT